MQPVDAFSVIEARTEPEPRIALGRAGSRETLTLDAATLLAQYALPWGDTLLVLDEDCPFEEALHLVLTRGSAVLDHVRVGFWYTPAIFAALDHRGNELRFTFESDAPWTLRASQSPRWRPWLLPAGACRRGRWFRPRHLSLSHPDAV